MSITRPGRTERQWPILLLLFIAVVLPTGSVLWFMTLAMHNERLAVRQKLTAVYQSQLTAIKVGLRDHWSEKSAALGSMRAEAPAPSIFEDIVLSGVADSVIVYDSSGSVRYPSRPAPPIGNGIDGVPEWREAWALEFSRADPTAAAGVYARIVTDAGTS